MQVLFFYSQKMKTLLDVHTHTVASGHAYSSLQEMVLAASEKGLEVLGVTEHGPSIEGTCPLLYFKNMHVVPRQMYGIRLLMGCEINILDTTGRLDVSEDTRSSISSATPATARLSWTSKHWCWHRKKATHCLKSTTIRSLPTAARPVREVTTWRYSGCANVTTYR